VPNKKLMRLYLLFLLFLFSFIADAQEGPIGTWRDHLPFSNGVAVTEGKGKIYCASQSALFSYDIESDEIVRMSTITGLSDVGISTIRFVESEEVLVIAYTNGNIDLLDNTNTIYNISAIKNSSIAADKRIYNIFISGDKVYLSCGFGIILLNISRKEVLETYLIGNLSTYVKVNDVAIFQGKIYAATDNGIYEAFLSSPNLADYNEWSILPSMPSLKYNTVEAFQNKLYVNIEYPIYNGDTAYWYDGVSWNKFTELIGSDNLDFNVTNNYLCIAHNGSLDVFDQNLTVHRNIFTYNNEYYPAPSQGIFSSGLFWIYIADKNFGLCKMHNSWSVEYKTPDGPKSNNAFKMDLVNKKIAVVPGGYDGTLNNLFTQPEFYYFDKTWKNFDENNFSAFDSIFDFSEVEIDPNDETHFFIGTWGGGLLEFKNEELINVFDETNSILQEQQGNPGSVQVVALEFDKDGNLWIVQPFTTNALTVLTKNGVWHNYNIAPYIDGTSRTSGLIIDDFNRKWVVDGRGHKIVVFDDGGTLTDKSDDQLKLVDGNSGSGNIPGSTILSITKDLDGEMWIGTDEGPCVIYAPGNVFDGGDYDAQQILIEQDGIAQILLETEIITTIEIDGANRKWFGTLNSGAYLMTSNGTKQVFHFTRQNSPLYANLINDIVVDNENGEVFFATEKGIISYKSTATEPRPDFSNVVVYPNPVKPGYTDLIAIKGLMEDTNVKITDVSGKIVFETLSLGGQAIWDGKSFSGNTVRSGVYLIFCVNPDGSQDYVAKLLLLD
jgi:hypothetical protein